LWGAQLHIHVAPAGKAEHADDLTADPKGLEIAAVFMLTESCAVLAQIIDKELGALFVSRQEPTHFGDIPLAYLL
jgi:hypothetical protein